jgi:hypothetical protein
MLLLLIKARNAHLKVASFSKKLNTDYLITLMDKDLKKHQLLREQIQVKVLESMIPMD